MTRPTPKVEKQRGRSFAEGGKGASNEMLREVPAEPAPPGVTGPAKAKAPGSLRARGGRKIPGYSVSLPAQPGHCAPIHKGR
jgi:hypothetical protein